MLWAVRVRRERDGRHHWKRVCKGSSGGSTKGLKLRDNRGEKGQRGRLERKGGGEANLLLSEIAEQGRPYARVMRTSVSEMPSKKEGPDRPAEQRDHNKKAESEKMEDGDGRKNNRATI